MEINPRSRGLKMRVPFSSIYDFYYYDWNARAFLPFDWTACEARKHVFGLTVFCSDWKSAYGIRQNAASDRVELRLVMEDTFFSKWMYRFVLLQCVDFRGQTIKFTIEAHNYKFCEKKKLSKSITLIYTQSDSNMISHVSFRNFLVMLTVLPSSVSAFNPINNKPSLPITSDITAGGLKAATIDSANDNEDLWSSMTKMIHSKIEEQGGDSLSEEAKDEIITTIVAGSVVGTVVGSPLVVGAALGFAGSQLLQGENGEKAREAIGHASKEMMNQANAAIDFTKKELENEKDLSKVSAKILLAIQNKAGEIQKDVQAQTSPSKMIEKLPALMADKLKENVMQTMESEEFKSLPKRSFNAFMAFMESEEVNKIKSGAVKALKDGQTEAVKALKDGLESEEMKALQSRASKTVQDGIDSASSKITKA